MRGERILMVEDELMWVELVRHWLAHAGYSTVDFATMGREAIEKATAAPPDCILLDLVLPDMGGLEVCRQLRSLPALSRVPVVLFTGHKKEKVLGLQSGADYFVAKEERPHELLATLDAVFRRKQMEEGTFTRGELTLKTQERRVFWREHPAFALSPKMFTLFYVLVERSPQPVARADLFRLVEGGEDPGLSRALDVMLNRLRKALPQALGARLVNVKNFGYVFLANPPVSAPPAAPAEQ